MYIYIYVCICIFIYTYIPTSSIRTDSDTQHGDVAVATANFVEGADGVLAATQGITISSV